MSTGSEIVFLSRTGRLKMVEDWKRGEIPNDFLYGFSEVIDSGVRWRIQEMEHPGGLRQKIDNQFKRIGQFLFRQNLPILTILNSVWKDRGRSVIYFTNIDSIAISYCLLKVLGLVSAPIIHVSQGLTNEFENRTGPVDPRWSGGVLAILIRQIDVLTVLGVGARKALYRHLGIPQQRVIFLPFGVDCQFWKPEKDFRDAKKNASYIVCVGSDAQRDYEILGNAKLPLPLKIVTRLNLSDSVIRASVEVRSDYSFKEIRNLYWNASIAILPAKDVSQPTGQSSALQAMACGCPVLMTDFRGLWDPRRIVNRENVLLMEPYNPRNLIEQLDSLLGNPEMRSSLIENAKQTVDRFYKSSLMGQRILRLCGSVDTVLKKSV